MAPVEGGLTASQMAVNEQMRRALEEDQYSANGSIVDTDSDDDELEYMYKGQSVRLDRAYLVQAARKHLWLERYATTTGHVAATTVVPVAKDAQEVEDGEVRPPRGPKKKKPKGKRSKDDDRAVSPKPGDSDVVNGNILASTSAENEFERDEGSIFGQTTGSSNSTWVECDKCKKVRSLSFLCVCKQNSVYPTLILSFTLLNIVAPAPWCRGRTKTASEMVLFHEQKRSRTSPLFSPRRRIRCLNHS